MSTAGRRQAKVAISGKGWKRPVSIAADKYDRVAQAILKALDAEPIRFTELVARVTAQLPGFDGSVSWYTISVARELELQGKVVRLAKPVLYAKAGSSVGQSASRPPRH